MKKLFVFILALVYLSEASGIGLHLHYCMNKLVSWGLTDTKNRCSSNHNSKDCSSVIKCKNCCKDELKTAKMDNANKVEQVPLIKSFLGKANHFSSILEPPVVASYTTINTNSINAPPERYKVAIFIFNRVFRI